MNLQCRKCGEQIEVPEEALSTTQPRVTCPGCSTSYRLRPRQDSTQVDPALRAADAGSQSALRPSESPAPETPAHPTFEPGQIVAERYRVVRFIAQGGMGEVYEAEDVELLQTVALKTISSRVGEESGILDRFKREIALARTVTHPNVCRIFDLGTHRTADEPVNFLTMELLRGETLSELLRRRHRLSTAEALPLIEQICSGLDAAHRARVVHRDLKSENVYLEGSSEARQLSELRVVLTDFGVARGTDAGDRFASQVTGLGIVGTPAYMAPEQVENKVITSKADLYSLGIVIYEMVTGHLPFEAESPLTTAVKRLREPPPPPHVHVPDLPAWWERAILRCLERRPDDRFPDARSVFDALQKPVRAGRRPATAERAAKPSSDETQNAGPARPKEPTARFATQAPRDPDGARQMPGGSNTGTVHGGTLHGGIAMGANGSKSRSRTGLWIASFFVAILAVLGALRWMDARESPDGGSPDPPSQAVTTPDATGDDVPDAGPNQLTDEAPEDVPPQAAQARELEASAELARRRGDLSTALRQYRQALALWRETGRAADELSCLTRLAGTLLDRGEMANADAQLATAEALADPLGEDRGRAAVLYQKGRLAALRGELDAATTHHEQALDLRERSGLDDEVPLSRLALARLDLDTGLPDRAELLAREAHDQALALGHRVAALRARALVIEALVADGRAKEAAAESTAAESTAAESTAAEDAVEARLELDLARARLAAATLPQSSSRAEIAEVLDRFDRIAAEAAGFGLRPLALRIRLQQAGIALERSTDRRDEALGRLRVVETEARAAGLLYFADRAKVILEYEA